MEDTVNRKMIRQADRGCWTSPEKMKRLESP